jgi:Glycosyltransferases involved in cell wall biogenesis
MQLPLVSVIIPNYNYAQFLEQRIDSVLNQSYLNIEVILLDDASTDHSLQVIENYRFDSRISHIKINSLNSGSPFSQWKKGLELASGKYVWIAESDDYADLSFLSITVPLLEKYVEASFCFAGGYRVDESGCIMKLDYDRWGRKQKTSRKGYNVFNGTEYILHNLFWRSYVYNASGVLFRRDLAVNLDFDLCISMHCSGDWLFWTEMARFGQVIEVYKKLNYCRYHMNSASTQAKKTGKSLEEDMVVVGQIEKYYFLHLSYYKRTLRHGIFYKKIRRAPITNEMKKKLYEKLKQNFKSGIEAYFLERFNKFLSVLPCVLTEKRDRL